MRRSFGCAVFANWNTVPGFDIDCFGVNFMNPCELTASITAIANAIACRLTVDELNLLAAVLDQLSDTLSTIATHRSICTKE